MGRQAVVDAMCVLPIMALLTACLPNSFTSIAFVTALAYPPLPSCFFRS